MENLDQTTELFKELCKYVGLNDFKIELYRGVIDYSITVGMSKKIEIAHLGIMNNPKQFIDEYLNPIIDNIKNSEAVKDSKYELTKQIEENTKKIVDLEAEISKLKEFETYYNMTFKMNHGK